MTECWKPVPNYEGLYEACTDGRIRSKDKFIRHRYGTRLLPGKLLSPCVNVAGYSVFPMTDARGTKRQHRHHRVIAQTHLPNPMNKPHINHKNGDKLDNSVINLEWVTPAENSQHAAQAGLLTIRRGEDHHNSKLTESDVRCIRQLYADGGVTYFELGEQFGVSYQTIHLVVKRKRWQEV